MCTINENHMIYSSWNIRCDRQRFLSFWAIFCPFTLLTTQKIKTKKKKWKKHLEISSFYLCVPKIMIRWYIVPEIWCAMDGQTDTDGWKKWHIEVGAPPKKLKATLKKPKWPLEITSRFFRRRKRRNVCWTCAMWVFFAKI